MVHLPQMEGTRLFTDPRANNLRLGLPVGRLAFPLQLPFQARSHISLRLRNLRAKSVNGQWPMLKALNASDIQHGALKFCETYGARMEAHTNLSVRELRGHGPAGDATTSLKSIRPF
jgi:hypothetical protein